MLLSYDMPNGSELVQWKNIRKPRTFFKTVDFKRLVMTQFSTTTSVCHSVREIIYFFSNTAYKTIH